MAGQIAVAAVPRRVCGQPESSTRGDRYSKPARDSASRGRHYTAANAGPSPPHRPRLRRSGPYKPAGLEPLRATLAALASDPVARMLPRVPPGRPRRRALRGSLAETRRTCSCAVCGEPGAALVGRGTWDRQVIRPVVPRLRSRHLDRAPSCPCAQQRRRPTTIMPLRCS